MLSRTATTRLVADILDLLERDWIAWANVLELLAYASGNCFGNTVAKSKVKYRMGFLGLSY